jgi:hypothetical protein
LSEHRPKNGILGQVDRKCPHFQEKQHLSILVFRELKKNHRICQEKIDKKDEKKRFYLSA